MNINIDLSASSVQAILRHVYTAAGTAVALATGLSFLSADQGATILAALHQIGDGLASIAGGVGLLVPLVSALFAARSASKPSQAAAVATTPGLVVVPTSDAGAAILDKMPEAAKQANR